MPAKVLVVDDDAAIRRLLRNTLVAAHRNDGLPLDEGAV